jgi:hypothetical protein
VGKSSLCNALGATSFESGVSFGGGLTKNLQTQVVTHEGKNVMLIDAPGLYEPDGTLTGKTFAANAGKIQEGLGIVGASYMVVFVVDLNSGRVSTADAAMVRSVLDAVSFQSVGYGFVFNKLSEDAYIGMGVGSNLRSVYMCLGLTDRPAYKAGKVPHALVAQGELTRDGLRAGAAAQLRDMFARISPGGVSVDRQIQEVLPADLERLREDLRQQNQAMAAQWEEQKAMYERMVARLQEENTAARAASAAADDRHQRAELSATERENRLFAEIRETKERLERSMRGPITKVKAFLSDVF